MPSSLLELGDFVFDEERDIFATPRSEHEIAVGRRGVVARTAGAQHHKRPGGEYRFDQAHFLPLRWSYWLKTPRRTGDPHCS